MERIRSVIFDIDDTLYSYTKADPIAKDALFSYCEEQHLLTRNEAAALHSRMFHRQQELLPNSAASHNRLIRYQMMLEEASLPLFPHALNMARIYWETLLEHAVPEDGIIELFRVLHESGIRIGIGTNMTSAIQFQKLERFHLAPYIDFVLTSEAACAEKPSPAFFEALLKKAACRPEECVFVGDSISHDINGALSAGLQAVLYHPDWQKEMIIPDQLPVIRSYRDCLTEHGIRFGSLLISH